MIQYKDFELNAPQTKHIKEVRVRKLIAAHIKENGVEPDSSTIEGFFNSEVPVEEIEKYRRMYYSIYCAGLLKNPFIGITKKCEYLYEATCMDVDYEYAFDYFKVTPQNIGGGCSSMRSGDFLGRNFDWYYNHDIDFVVHTPRIGNRYASVGVAGCFPYLTKEIVDSGKATELFKIFPFYILDGINEHGVVINVNVVPGQDMECTTTGTEPLGEKKGDLCMNMLPRFVLDNYASAREAIDDIRNHWSVYMKPSDLLGHYEVHYMIGDENETYVVEFFNNEMYVEQMNIDGSKLAIMTNFYLKGINLIEGKVGNVGDNLSNLTPYGSGVDRYNILADVFENAGLNKDNMMEAMKSVWYSKTYEEGNKWYSEMVGSPDYVLDPDKSQGILVDMNTPMSHYDPIFENIKGWYDARNRDEWKVWHTTHTSVYDIKNRKLYFRFQENEIEDKEYVFVIENNPYGWPNEDGKDY